MARPRGSKQQREQAMRLQTGGGKFIGYVRVSTADQGENGHSLDGQRSRIEAAARREGLTLVDVVCDVESGAKQRDGLDEAWERIVAGEAEGLLFCKLDRVGRSQQHLFALVQEARDRGLSLLGADETWHVRRGELVSEMVFFLMAFAQVERERISRRTREGLAAAKAKGVKLGRPAENVGEAAERATELRRTGMPWATIAKTLNDEGYTTARGGQFYPATVGRMIDRTDPTANPEGGYRP